MFILYLKFVAYLLYQKKSIIWILNVFFDKNWMRLQEKMVSTKLCTKGLFEGEKHLKRWEKVCDNMKWKRDLYKVSVEKGSFIKIFKDIFLLFNSCSILDIQSYHVGIILVYIYSKKASLIIEKAAPKNWWKNWLYNIYIYIYRNGHWVQHSSLVTSKNIMPSPENWRMA